MEKERGALEGDVKKFHAIIAEISGRIASVVKILEERCDAPKPGGPLTTRQPAEYKWRSSYPTPL